MKNINLDKAKQEMITEYEEVICGKRKTYSSYYFVSNDKSRNQDIALAAFHYAFENLLHYTPEAVRNRISKELLIKMKLLPLYTKRIFLPSELDKRKDYYYISNLMYPNIFSTSVRQNTTEMYENILKGKIKKFPKNVFDGEEGREKACICLQRVITEYVSIQDFSQLYEFFVSDDIERFLTKFRLDIVCNALYEYPIDYLQDALPSQYKMQDCYEYARRVAERKRSEKAITASINGKNSILSKYKKLLETENNSEAKEIERSLFETSNGRINAVVCFNYIFENEIKGEDICDLYDLFLSNKIEEILLEKRLLKPCKKYFTSFIDFLHNSLPSDKRDVIAYTYAKTQMKKKGISDFSQNKR